MTVSELIADSRNFVPPSVASEFLGCSQYALNLQAKAAQAAGRTAIGCIRYYFAGRNLKLCKADIVDCVRGCAK